MVLGEMGAAVNNGEAKDSPSLVLIDYYDETKTAAADECGRFVSDMADETSRNHYNGYYCFSKSKGNEDVFFSVFSRKSLVISSIVAPDFSSDCCVCVQDSIFDASDPDLNFGYVGGFFTRAFWIERSGKRIVEHCYRRNWKHELLHGDSDGAYKYEDFFSYLVSHAVKVRRSWLSKL